jgi:hypothetical protein
MPWAEIIGCDWALDAIMAGGFAVAQTAIANSKNPVATFFLIIIAAHISVE